MKRVLKNKSIPACLQEAIDRTRSEQSAIVRSTAVYKQALRQWREYVGQVDAVTRSGRAEWKREAEATAKIVEDVLVSFRQLGNAARAAEDAVVNGTRPMEAAVRGCLGPEVSELVLTLRGHLDTIDRAEKDLVKLKMDLGKRVVSASNSEALH